MASRLMNPGPRVFETEAKQIRLTFYPQAGSAPTVNANQSRGVASVTRTGAGLFTITLSDSYRRLVSKQISVQVTGDATDLYGQFGDIDLTAKTVKVRLMTGATPTDLAANANNSVSVTLDFADSDAY